jgi:hypothetical protein
MARPRELEMEAGEVIPLHRPWRAWLIGSAIALLSATIGSIYGIRSQAGGPRGNLERQVVRNYDGVNELRGSVNKLEQQSSAFANSINALDARITDQERARSVEARRPEHTRVASSPRAPEAAAPANARPAPVSPSEKSEVRENVRQALRTLDPYLGQARADQPLVQEH